MPVDQRHDREILSADLGRLPVDCRARHRQQPALLRYRQPRVLALDHHTPFRSPPDQVRGFRAKNRFRPSAGRSAGTEGQPPLSRGQALCLAGRRRHGRVAALENIRRAVQQRLFQLSIWFGWTPNWLPNSATRPVTPDRRQRHLGLERRVVLLACPLHVLLPRHRRFLGAGLHLSQPSHFRGPPQSKPRRTRFATEFSGQITNASSDAPRCKGRAFLCCMR